jgi:hypothetical protein
MIMWLLPTTQQKYQQGTLHAVTKKVTTTNEWSPHIT